MTYRIGFFMGAVLLLLAVSKPALGTSFNVFIDTSAVAGSSDQLAFDFTVNSPSFLRHADILNFSAPGSTAGLPQTQGGLVFGGLILPPFNSAAFTRIGGSFFFNELIVTFTSFGSSIFFTLNIADIGRLLVFIDSDRSKRQRSSMPRLWQWINATGTLRV